MADAAPLGVSYFEYVGQYTGFLERDSGGEVSLFFVACV